jgi:hypothetical protein
MPAAEVGYATIDKEGRGSLQIRLRLTQSCSVRQVLGFRISILENFNTLLLTHA